MWNRVVSGFLLYPFLLAGVIVSTFLGFLVPSRWILPLLNLLSGYPVLATLLARDQRRRAFAAMLFWALCLGVVVVTATIYYPVRAQHVIYNGTAYTDQMFQWIRTGRGAEGDPFLFVPQHLVYLFVFTLLSAASAGILGLLMGILLMNYMSCYAAGVILASHDKMLAALMCWHPWSIIRVASFVVLGVILAEPVLAGRLHKVYEYDTARPYFWAALGGLGLDIILKAALAPWWGIQLRHLIGN